MGTEVLELEGKFLSAKKLNLTENQRCGLIMVLANIEAGKFMHIEPSELTEKNIVGARSLGKTAFNMNHWWTRLNCGSVCCLGGSAEMLSGAKFEGAALSDATKALFAIGNYSNAPSRKATEKQAGVALRNYLETGHPNWDAALKTPR